MQKVYTTQESKIWQKSKIHRREKNNRSRKIKKNNSRFKRPYTVPTVLKKKRKKTVLSPKTVYAPTDFRLINNTEACLLFFRNIRSSEYINFFGKRKFVVMSLVFVKEIDYAAISCLTAISDDLKFNNIILKGDFPDDPNCKKFIVDSGFLNHMVDEKNQRFPKAIASELIFFEKGCGKLSDNEIRKITELVKKVVNHLTGTPTNCLPIKTIILEICGNSIEWAKTENRQWLLGVQYSNQKVIFTVTDVGEGILKTLHKKFGLMLSDIFRTELAILKGVFVQKYGSSTQEANRNKGLPSVRANFQRGTILNLKVLTNNVILHFENEDASKTFSKGSPRFKGTLYQWEMNKMCIEKAIN